LKHTVDQASTNKYSVVYNMILLSKASFSHNCLDNGVTLGPS